jgi:hypothetical protein
LLANQAREGGARAGALLLKADRSGGASAAAGGLRQSSAIDRAGKTGASLSMTVSPSWQSEQEAWSCGTGAPVAGRIALARRRRAPEGRADLRQQGDADDQRCEEPFMHGPPAVVVNRAAPAKKRLTASQQFQSVAKINLSCATG